MIQQLILGVLLACDQKKEDIVTGTNTPIQKKAPPKIPGQVIIVEKLSTPKPSNSSKHFHSSSVSLSHIPYPRASFNDDLFCTYVCNYANNDRGSDIAKVENCRLELISNWEEMRKDLTWEELNNKGDSVVGNVECNADFIEHNIGDYIEGRTGISSTKGTISTNDLGGYFARAAQEEMTAVFAFQEMLENLKSFDAPQQLLDDCERAICDERRHMIMMSNMAKRHGCSSAIITLPKQKSVSLFELTKHNAIAGCIEETWAALIAAYRSKHSKHYSKLFNIIAKDEIFHAQLSWDIHKWLMTQLSEEEQREIQHLMLQKLKTSPTYAHININLGEMTQTIQSKFWHSFAVDIQKKITSFVA